MSQPVTIREALTILCRNLAPQDQQLVIEYATSLICRSRLSEDVRSRVLRFRLPLERHRKSV